MKQTDKAQQVIGAVTEALCDKALHISIEYKSKDIFKCVRTMTAEEFSIWCEQPATLHSVICSVFSKANADFKGLVSYAFEVAVNKQLDEAVTLLEETA